MRPTSQAQSSLHTPLNAILGTEGAVRVLRVLSGSPTPVSAGIVAQRAQLQRSTARRTLQPLVATGMVAATGAVGGVPHYAMRLAHPLAAVITTLFVAEERRASAVVEGLADATLALTPPPIAAWIEGPAAEGTDGPEDAIQFRILDGAPRLPQTLIELRPAIQRLEDALDVTIELSGLTFADVAARLAQEPTWGVSLRRARIVGGLPPSIFLERAEVSGRTAGASTSESTGVPRARPRLRTHADLDAGALDVARAIVARMDHDPTLLPRAREFVARRLQQASARERHELEEWANLLRRASPQRLRHVLLDPGERGTRLRQTWPFPGVLTEAERATIRSAAITPSTDRTR